MKPQELFAALTARIVACKSSHPLRVAVDGVDAAGKTELANELVAPLQAAGYHPLRASIDGFHHPAEFRHRRGSLSPVGYYHDSFDHQRLIIALLAPLGPGGSRLVRRAVFDFRADAAVDAPLEEFPERTILLFDGVFLLRPELREYWDISIFVHADFEITLARAQQRDLALFGSAEQVRQRYEARYIPGQRLYLAESEPTRRATLVVDNNDPENPSLRKISP